MVHNELSPKKRFDRVWKYATNNGSPEVFENTGLIRATTIPGVRGDRISAIFRAHQRPATYGTPEPTERILEMFAADGRKALVTDRQLDLKLNKGKVIVNLTMLETILQ